jgi:hypothetical protein
MKETIRRFMNKKYFFNKNEAEMRRLPVHIQFPIAPAIEGTKII